MTYPGVEFRRNHAMQQWTRHPEASVGRCSAAEDLTSLLRSFFAIPAPRCLQPCSTDAGM